MLSRYLNKIKIKIKEKSETVIKTACVATNERKTCKAGSLILKKKMKKRKKRTYCIRQKNLYDRKQPPVKFHRCNFLSETESKTRKEEEN